MSLCFKDAFSAWKGNEITEEESVNHLLPHFRGIRRPGDSDDRNFQVILQTSNPYAASIQHEALETKYERLQDTTLHEKLFYTCLGGNADLLRSDLERPMSAVIPSALAARCSRGRERPC